MRTRLHLLSHTIFPSLWTCGERQDCLFVAAVFYDGDRRAVTLWIFTVTRRSAQAWQQRRPRNRGANRCDQSDFFA